MHCDCPSMASPAGSRGCAIFTADATGVELVGSNGDAAAQLDISLGDMRSRVEIGAVVERVRFHSRRDGDIVVALGGTVHNRWDTPLAATGEPFGFNGENVDLTLIAEPDGLRRTACRARTSLPTVRTGSA